MKWLLFSIKIILLHLTLILVFFSCKKEECQVIDIDIKKYTDKLRVQIDTIILLETNNASLIGEIHKIKHFKGNFYVIDFLISKNVFLFDSKGRFISSLPRGKGPGEVLSPVEIIIDKERERIIVWDQGNRKLLVYDIYLNYLFSEHHENLFIQAAEFIDSNRILVNSPVFSNSSFNTDEKVLYSIYNLKKREYEAKFFPISQNLTSIGTISPISVASNRVLFSSIFDNSLYILANNGYKKAYHFNFGEMSINTEDINKGIEYIYGESWTGNKIVPFYSINESENFLALNFGLYGMDNFLLYSKSSGAAYFSFNLVNDGLLPNCRLSGITMEGKYLAFATSDHILEFDKFYEKAAKVKTEIDETSNPCLVIFSVHEDE